MAAQGLTTVRPRARRPAMQELEHRLQAGPFLLTFHGDDGRLDAPQRIVFRPVAAPDIC
jgi:hypothetical protein